MQTDSLTAPEKIRRNFLPSRLNLDEWNSIDPFYKNLADRMISGTTDLIRWLADLSEIDAVIEEHAGWLYIRMTCDTTDKKLTEAYVHFVEEINPKIEPYTDLLNRKLNDSPYRKELDARYQLFLKQVENSIRIFREENIALKAELQVKEQKYGEIAGAMSVDVDGKKLTLQQASNFLKDPNRQKRDEVYHMITSRRQEDRSKLDDLFNELIRLRNTISVNAGFANYRDYKFVELDRFDYTPEDCLRFHESVRTCVVPVLNEMAAQRKSEMKLDVLKPWDLEVDTTGLPDLKPFDKGDQLMDQTIRCFSEIHPYFGEVTRTLQSMKYIDLDSRIGKAPGGYNYPLYESGVPFIFMNASGSLKDVITMVHEGGHAIHSMLTRDLDFIGFKELPSEVAELASMSMELISMEHWHHYFPNENDLRRARREQLENVIEALPWITCIDHYQHWLYMHPEHTNSERTAAWKKIFLDFSSSVVDWRTDQAALELLWQKQLHLYEVPFYYIEYGMAQLGAIAVWRNYKNNPKKGIEQYMAALRLGYTKPIPEIYATAGIRFDFSEAYIRELIDFVKSEMAKL